MKSFVALDMALSIAACLPWHGCPVKQGPVVYIAGEGFGGLAKRIKAWMLKRGVGWEIPLCVSDRAVAVLDHASLAEAHDAIDDLAGRVGNPALVVVDTVARNFGPGDENSTKDMSAFVAGLDAIKARYSCAVLAVHHTGLNSQDRGRGAYALHAGLDYEFRLDVQGDVRVLTSTKTKDDAKSQDVAFLPEIVSTGWTDPETGDGITSVVLNRTDLPGKKERALSGAKRVAFDTLMAFGVGSQVHVSEWQLESCRRGVSTAEDQDNKRRVFKRAVTELLDLGLVETHDDYFWVAGQPGQKPDMSGLVRGHQPGRTGQVSLDLSVVRSPDAEKEEVIP